MAANGLCTAPCSASLLHIFRIHQNSVLVLVYPPDCTPFVQPGLVRKVQTLWTGVGPTLMKDVPFAGLYWSLLEPFKSRLAQEMHLRPESPRSHVSPIITICCAATGPDSYSFVTH